MHIRNEIYATLCGVLLSTELWGCYPSRDPNEVSLSPNVAAGFGGEATTDGAAGDDTPAIVGGSSAEAGSAAVLAKCVPATGESLPQRSDILSLSVQPTEREVFVTDLFEQFSSSCKGCHVDQALGGFQATKTNYLARLQNPEVLKRLTSDDLSYAMPSPATVPYSKRPEGDSIRGLVKLLTEWGAANYPADLFIEKLPASSGQSPYALSAKTGALFSNIGTCVPSSHFAFASETDLMARLDEDFAARKGSPDDNAALGDQIGLPSELADTDLTSFDSEVLARRGIIAFAPAYPLWSDDAGKLRYVRVPLGKSIHFNRTTQSFEIPDNTRFYKTFMKKVKDAAGNERWRKLETRLIVARADLNRPTPGQTYTPQALFGTYKWDEAETHATLLIDGLRNGRPFSDDVVNFIEDEPAAAEVRAQKPPNLTSKLESKNLIRHWAIPGSQRCIHCHMGSSNGDFILGFTPLQINRRPMGEGGVYEPAETDELTQLQRLIDFGVITGIKSPSDIVKLEDSQLGDPNGPRGPRNDQELKAQAYLLANCAHCHNPHGFPSVANSELIPLLNFYPSAEGGVFQFPLERYSPRITRGTDNSKIAYVTPSLRDIIPGLAVGAVTVDYQTKYEQLDGPPPTTRYFNAPWRSLIYRNTQTPFTYSESLTLYPHMPFDTAGHDCRAGQWLGEWMASIPAVRKHPQVPENFTVFTTSSGVPSVEGQDIDPQPYAEVKAGAPGFEAAVKAAARRVADFRTDVRYGMCPDNSDIVDPDVTSGRFPTPLDKNGDGVPDRPNWVVTDLTERKGLWEPRRSDWQEILKANPPKAPPVEGNPQYMKKSQADAIIVEQLAKVHLSDVGGGSSGGFAETPFPMGIWQQKTGCKFDTVPKVSAFTGAARPAWMDEANPDANAPVFSVLPGQAIFDMICINCHGPNADSLGRQADTLQNLTGGAARVANFRFGLFNPSPQDDPYDKPDRGALLNRERVFGAVATGAISPDDWGARYLSWMALGGTGVTIPKAILQQVARTDVLGASREKSLVDQGDLSANMLQVAQAACGAVLASNLPFALDQRRVNRRNSNLIINNGDAELWTKVCAQHNPAMHKILVSDNGEAHVFPAFFPLEICDATGQPEGCFPTSASIGDQNGNIIEHIGEQLDPANVFPWCIAGSPDDPKLRAIATKYARNGTPLPICPVQWSATDDIDAQVRWTNRGAINAGLSVFAFLNHFIKGETTNLLYDQCDKLP